MNTNDHVNNTYNQHFISQAEQRLNSCTADPNSEKPEIHCFDITDKKNLKIKYAGKNLIKRNMSFRDIFTLAKIGDSDRINFERLFGIYEAQYPLRVKNLQELIAKAKDRAPMPIGAEGLDLETVLGEDFPAFMSHVKYFYTYKLMNWLRNPYTIKNVLKTFDSYVDHSIAKPGALELYFALTAKNEGEERHICSSFNITPTQYKQWIRLLLLFLYSESDEPSSLEGFAEEFFLAPEFANAVLVHEFEDRCALLTDTGVVRDSISDGISTYMNITKNLIIALQHTKADGKHVDEIVKQFNLSTAQREELVKKIQKSVTARLCLNHYDILAGYNQICVKAAEKQVFSASKIVDGVDLA